MGDRLTPIDLSWGNSSTFTTNVNTNFDDVATLLDSFLSRTDSTNPNYMDVVLDMNSNDINNAGTIRCDVLLIDNAQIPSLEDIQEAHADYLATLGICALSINRTSHRIVPALLMSLLFMSSATSM